MTAVIPVDLTEQLRAHDERIRHLEQDRASWTKLDALEEAMRREVDRIEERVRHLEIASARAWVVISVAAFVASAVGSGLVAWAFRAIGS